MAQFRTMTDRDLVEAIYDVAAVLKRIAAKYKTRPDIEDSESFEMMARFIDHTPFYRLAR